VSYGIFNTCILDNILQFSGKKQSLALHLLETDTDPDQEALDADTDPQHCDPIQIVFTLILLKTLSMMTSPSMPLE
jgi:hypothetical protein